MLVMDLTDTVSKEVQQLPDHPRALSTGRGNKLPSLSNIVSQKQSVPEPSDATDMKSSVTTGADHHPSVLAQRRQLKARRSLTQHQGSAGARGKWTNSECSCCTDKTKQQEEVCEGQMETGLCQKQASYVLRKLRKERLHTEEVRPLLSCRGSLSEPPPAPPPFSQDMQTKASPLLGSVERGSSQLVKLLALGPNRLQPITSTQLGRTPQEPGAGSGSPTPRGPLKDPLPVTVPRNQGSGERALEGSGTTSEEGEGQRIDPEALRKLQESLLQEEELEEEEEEAEGEGEDGHMYRVCNPLEPYKCAGVLPLANQHYQKTEATSGNDHPPSTPAPAQKRQLKARRSLTPHQASAGARGRTANLGCLCCLDEAQQQEEQEGTEAHREFGETCSAARLCPQQTYHVLQKLRKERLRRNEARMLRGRRRGPSEMPPVLFSRGTQTTLSHHCSVEAESSQAVTSSRHRGRRGKVRRRPGAENNPPTVREPLPDPLPVGVPWSQSLGEPLPEQPPPCSEHGEHQRALADPEEMQRSPLQKEEEEEDEEEGDMCRICLVPGGTPLNPLLEPCRCVGSLQFVHQDCLKEWLKAKVMSGAELAAVTSCELCHHALKLDFDNFDVNEFYREQAARQVEERTSDSNLLVAVLLHFYEQRFSDLMQLLNGSTTVHQFTTDNSQPGGESTNSHNSDSEELDW